MKSGRRHDPESEGVTKKKKRKVVSYLDTEAQEDDDEGEEEFIGDEADDLVDDFDEAEEAQELEIAQRRQIETSMKPDTQTRRGGAGHLASAIGNLERRYQDQDYATGDAEGNAEDFGEGNYNEEGEEGDEVFYDDQMPNDLSRILPSAGGWRLWKVPTVRPGVERDTCIQILRKFAEAPEARREDFQIGAAYACDSIKGAVYIEAPSPLHIIDALREVRTLLLARNQIKSVPLREMGDVFNMGALAEELPRKGDWVRFTRGLYAGDLALVSDVDEAHHSVTIRVIPRIDVSWEVKAIATEQATGQKVPPPRTRPAPAFIFLTDLESRGIEAERVNFITEAFRFRSHVIEERTGYLLKNAKVSTLVTGERVRPTSVEIETFANGRDLNEVLGDFGVGVGGASASEGAFEAGQQIYVTKGDLAGIEGRVVSVQGTQLRIQPDDEAVTAITIPASYCVKRFNVGESVKVIAGRNEGDVGLIVKLDLDKGTAFVLSTDTHQQITCNLFHLAATPNDTLTPAGLTKIEGYAVGDLAQMSTTLDVGVIVKIFRSRRLEILTKDGMMGCDVSQLCGKKTLRLARSLDSANVQFGTGASVEILEGSYAKKIGTVRYIWKDSVFVNVPSAVTTGGIVAVDSGAVRVVQGGENETPLAEAGRPAQGQPGAFRPVRPMGIRTNFALMGTQVKLVAGPQKGLSGELRGLQGADAVVLVNALGKEMRFPRTYLQLQDSEKASEVARFFRGGPRGGRGGMHH